MGITYQRRQGAKEGPRRILPQPTARRRVTPRQPHLSAGEEGPPGGPDPWLSGDLGGRDPSSPQGFWASPHPPPGMLCFSHPPCCRDHQEGEQIARRPSKVIPRALAVSSVQVSLSSSLQHRRVSTSPLTSPLDLFPWPADGLWDGETGMLSLGLTSRCSVTSLVVSAVLK